MQKKWDIAKNRIPLDQCNLASQEARELFDYFGEYTAGVTRKTEPATPGECPFLNFRLINSEAIENFYEIAPTIGNILLSYSGIQPSFGRVPTEYFPTGITINFADATSHVPSHIDQGKDEEVSYITSLCGVADFTIEGHYKDFSHSMRVNPGDVHMLHNPANYEERLWHGAKTIGDEPRISLAARMPLLNI